MEKWIEKLKEKHSLSDTDVNTLLEIGEPSNLFIESMTERWHIQMWRQSALDRYLALLDEYPEVIQKIPMKYIASYLGVTAQSLSRIRASLI